MRVLIRNLSSCRMFCSVTQEETLNFRYRARPRKNSYGKLIQEIFGSTYPQGYDFFYRNPFLKDLDHKHIRDVTNVLRELQIEVKEIKACPRVFLILPVTLEHHLRVLKESGFLKVSPYSAIIYSILVRKKIRSLKVHGLLPEDANVCRNFLNTLKAPENVFKTVDSIIDINSDENNISYMRDTILKSYLEWRLDASREEVEHIFSTYARVLNKSLYLIGRTLSILLDDLQFPKEHITKNGFLIQVHPVQLQKILDKVPYLAGKPIRDVLYDHPSIATASYENFIEILTSLREAGIPEESIISHQNIFYLSGQCVRERLPLLSHKMLPSEVKPIMDDDKKFLRVLVNYENVNQRVQFLNSQRRSSSLPQVVSLHLLTSRQVMFERFVKGMGGATYGSDLVNYLVKSLRKVSGVNDPNITSSTVRTMLKKNPNWRNVPISEVIPCFEMLCKKGYKAKDIHEAITILLYSAKTVENNLKKLFSQPEVLECFQLDGLLGNDFLVKNDGKSKTKSRCRNFRGKNSKKALIKKYSLQLCLYYLEKGNHFSGDGIWFRE
ncbi:transcription termination factor 5, mitochondrial [Hetaerina americana]|uniref:transcription termination factor 5, mitochondrial n=1 Tax=Hetaerina americana TaxID=62018 RepID=UPI003A7F3B00